MTEEKAKRKLVDWCKSQIGYHEGYDGSNKYADGQWDVKLYGFSAINVPWCFTEGTLILTENGYKPVQDINVGDRVLSANGHRFNKVTRIEVNDALVCAYRVYGALPFSVTPDHPFLCEKRKDKHHRKNGFKDWGYHPILELNRGDMIAVPHSPVLYDDFLSYDELWTVGYYVGDGHCSRRNEYVLSANDIKAKKIDVHAEGHWGKDYASSTCHQFNLCVAENSRLRSVLEDCGHGAENKRVPRQILFGSIEAKKAFLDGYFSADGCEKYHSFNSISEELVTGIARLLFDIGSACSINPQRRPSEGKIWDSRLNAYRTFHQNEVIYNCSVCNTDDERHQDYLFKDTFTMLPLRDIGEHRVDTVYTITTDGDHSYTANNLGVHNCDVFVDASYIACFGFSDATAMTYQQPSGYAACTLSADAYKRNGAFYQTPEVGDQIFFFVGGGINHTGIVIEVNGNDIVCVEGNYSDSVMRTRYKVGDRNIAGYGRPNWSIVSDEEHAPDHNNFDDVDDTQFDVVHPEHRRTYMHLEYGDGIGHPLPQVKAWQSLLACWGFILDADGEFGFDTENATRQWQQKAQEIGADVEINGVVDEDDWKEVIEVPTDNY